MYLQLHLQIQMSISLSEASKAMTSSGIFKAVERQCQLGVCKRLKELLENLFHAQINVLTNFSKL